MKVLSIGFLFNIEYAWISKNIVFKLFCFFRLWGDHGQAALETAHVCLINVTGMGTEILKSLVLPGIGAFTIVDGGIVSEEDIGIK